MNFYGDLEIPCCYFHPNEEIVGICALCLKERLLKLAAKQGHHHQHQHHIPLSKDTHGSFTNNCRRKPTITFPQVFPNRRLEPHPQGDSHDDSDEGSISSLEDSFISMTFEEDGRPSWNKKKSSPGRLGVSPGLIGSNQEGLQAKESKGGRSILLEHSKPSGSFRWGKKIVDLLQMSEFKRPSKATTSHVGLMGKVEGAKGRRFWFEQGTLSFCLPPK